MIASNNKIERWFRRHHEKAIRGADGCWFLRKAKEAWSMRRHLSGEMDWGPIHRLWICLRHASHRFHASLPAPWSSNLSRVSSKLCLCPPYGEGNGTPLQYSCLENPMDGGAWKAEVHGVTEGQTRLSDFTFTFHFHALEKEMATHSSVLAWRTPGMGELGGLLSVGSHRVRHNWIDVAAAAVTLYQTEWL